MADKYRIKNHSKILLKQAQDLLEDIGNDVRSKKLTKASEVMRRMLTSMRDLFTDIGKPTMKKRYAPIDGPPWSEDYNKTMTEINNDLNTIYQEMEHLEDGIITDYNYGETQRQRINSHLKIIKERLEDFVLFSNIDKDMVHAKDTFLNTDKIDYSKIKLPIATLDTDEGVVTLKRSDSENMSTVSSIEIVESDSNGFPGNTHQVKAKSKDSNFTPEERDESEWVFYGEEDMHIVPMLMLDSNPDTWFEYETCDIPDSKKAAQKYYGFTYKNGEWWARDPVEPYTKDSPQRNNKQTSSDSTKSAEIGDVVAGITGKKDLFTSLNTSSPKETPNTSTPLRLSLEVTLPEPTIVNWININPYIPPFDGSTPPRIVDIFISDGENYKKSILDSTDKNMILSEELNESSQTYDENDIPDARDFTGQAVYTFPPALTKTISIIIEQDAPYDCRIGHIYYERVDTIKVEETGPLGGLFGGNDTYTEEKRTLVEGPKVPLSSLYSDWDDALGIDNTLDDTFLEPLGNLLSSISGFLFGGETHSLVDSRIESGINGFEGWRWAIGIKGINIYAYNFESTSEIISKKHIVGDYIQKVSLTVNEEIPKEFLTDQLWNKRNDWIKYYISVDGTSWHRINPEGHGETKTESGDIVPEIYEINSQLAKENRDPRKGYIDIDKFATDIRFRAVLSRPTNIENAENYTPVLRGYALKMHTEGENG